MPMKLGTAINVVAAVALAAACAAIATPAEPTTAPAPTTQHVSKLYACLPGPNGVVLGEDLLGLTPLQQVTAGPWFAEANAVAKRTKSALFVDYEPPNVSLIGIGTTKDLQRLADLDAYVTNVRQLLRKARTDADAKDRLVGIYTDLPIGQAWQYGDDQSAYIADNRRLAATGVLDDADAVCVGAYLHIDDIKGMTPALAAEATRKRIEAARLYGKPIIVFIMPRWEAAKAFTPVSDELLETQYAVIQKAGVDACVWNDRDSVPHARALAAAAKAQFSRATTMP